jgi:hypothetical protein
MSAEQNPQYNQEPSAESHELQKAITERLEHVAPKNAAEHGHAEQAGNDQLEAIRQKINETATKKTELASAVTVPEDTSRQQVYLDKKGARQHKLQEVQSNLSGSERTFSKVVHNAAITKASDAVGNTIARPTSLFWGGLFACLATATLYFTAKYIGFQYNYLISFISFVGGYLVGLVVELLLKLVHRPSTT